ncbi:ParA family protein [Arcanobacterium haemolyticum]
MIIAVCNQKGGVGKTTISTNLAHHLSQQGSVLVIDADPQGNSTTSLGVEVTRESFTLNDVMAAIAAGNSPSVIHQAITHAQSDWGNVDVLPADRLLASRNDDGSLGRESRLRTALTAVTDDYEHIVIDCPPSLGVLTTNALVAADTALIVTTARETSVDGVAEMVSTIATVRSYYNSRLTLSAIFLNAFRPERIDSDNWRRHLRDYYEPYLLEKFLPEREYINRAASSHSPIPAGVDDRADQALHELASIFTNASKAS